MLSMVCAAVVLSSPPSVIGHRTWKITDNNWSPPFTLWVGPNSTQIVHVDYVDGGYDHSVDVTMHGLASGPWSAYFRAGKSNENPTKYVVSVSGADRTTTCPFKLEVNETSTSHAGPAASWTYRSLVSVYEEEVFLVGEGTHYFLEGFFEGGYTKHKVTVIEESTASRVRMGNPVQYATPIAPRKWRKGFFATAE